MKSKALVYTVLAVALGYFLISAVPDQMETLQGVRQRGSSVESESLAIEAPESADKFEAEPDELASGLSEAVIAEIEEPEEVARGGVRDGAVALGVWAINLMIALGVYFIVKRRLS